jgi:multidrug resistance efflux pump
MNISSDKARQSNEREPDDIGEDNLPATQEMRRGYRSMVWLLIVLIAVIVMVLAMWGRMHSNAASTVNPAQSQPVGDLH